MPWFEAGGNAICSTKVRSPGSFCCWASTAAVPAAMHPTARTQVTVVRRLSALAFGLGSMDQDEPFQFSMTACGWKPPPPPPPNPPREPTAQHCAVLRHEMPLRMPGVEGSGTDADRSVQAAPFQCSMRIPDAFPLPSVIAPEAQQSASVTHVTP